MQVTVYDWSGNKSSETLDFNLIKKLIEGYLPACVVSSLLSDGECDSIVSKIPEESIEWTMRNTPVGRFGLTARSQIQQLQDFGKSSFSNKTKELRNNFDILRLNELFVSRFKNVLEVYAHVEIYRYNEMQLICPVIRYFDDALLHYDFVPFQDHSWHDMAKIECQLSGNVHLNHVQGNTLHIYNKRFSEQDISDKSQIFGFNINVVKSLIPVSIQPVKGDLILMNTTFYHSFDSCIKGQAIMMGLFAGITSQNITIWP